MIRYIFILAFFLSTNLFAQTDYLSSKLYLARSYEEKGEYAEAEKIYKTLIEKQPQNQIYLDGLNKLYLKSKNYNASISLLTNSIKIFPQNIALYGMLGVTYHMMDNKKLAREIWQRGIDIKPGSPVSYRTIAQFVIQQRDLDEGIAILKRGRESLTQLDLYAYDLASLYTSTMKFKEAAAEYCLILQTKPDQLNIVIARMKGYIFRGEALNITLEYMGNIPANKITPPLYSLQSFLYESSGEYNRAYELLKKATEMSGDRENELMIFANKALSAGNYDAAVKAFEFVHDNYPDSPGNYSAQLGIARALDLSVQKQKITNDEWKPVRKSVTTSPEFYASVLDKYSKLTDKSLPVQIKSEALYRMGMIYMNKPGNYKIADSLFNQITTQYRGAQYLRHSFNRRGDIAVIEERLIDAEREFKFAAQLPGTGDYESSYTQFMKIKSVFWRGNFDETEQLISQFTNHLERDHANDIIELNVLIHTMKTDSAGLVKYSKADLLLAQKKFNEAASLFDELSHSGDGSLTGIIAKFKYAEILIAQNEFPKAALLLEEIAKSDETSIFQDKALYLQSQIYQFGIANKFKAIKIYENLLATFPNSLYLDKVRENINILKPKY